MCTRKSIENMFRPRIHSEDGRYWAEIPAMPGCFTVADTLDELRGNLIEAAQCWLLTSADMENYRRNDRRRIERKRRAERKPLADRHDPFFDEPNASHLRRAIADMDAGRNIVFRD